MGFVYNWLLRSMICSFIFIFIFNLTYIIHVFQIMGASIIHFLKILLFYFYITVFCISQHPISFPFWKVKFPFYLKYVLLINLQYVSLGLPRCSMGYLLCHRAAYESAALNMPANLENSAVATRLEKVSFQSNPKERQCQRMLQLLNNCTHLTH